MDERFLCSTEDVDFSFRLRFVGWIYLRASRARIRHPGSGITGRVSDFSLYHGHRNQFWTSLKNTPREIFWIALPYYLAVNAHLSARARFASCGAPLGRAYRDAWRSRRSFLQERKAPRPRFKRPLRLGDLSRTLVMPRLRKPAAARTNP